MDLKNKWSFDFRQIATIGIVANETAAITFLIAAFVTLFACCRATLFDPLITATIGAKDRF